MFSDLKAKVRDQFAKMCQSTVFVVNYDRDVIWQTYLQAFREEGRQEHNCNSCKAFIRQAGGAVTIDPDTLELRTVWDVQDVPEEYAASIEALRVYISGLPIVGLFHHESQKVGTDKNVAKDAITGKDIIWQHFQVMVPNLMVTKPALVEKSATLRDSANVLKRCLTEITADCVSLVLELIDQGSLYRGAEFRPAVASFQAVQNEFAELPPGSNTTNWCWLQADTLPVSVSRIRGTSIGTLLTDLSEGMELDHASRAYHAKVAPGNYKRTTSLVTASMIRSAKEHITELGLLAALDRRVLDTRDLTPERALYVFRPKAKVVDLFAQLAGEVPVDMKTLAKVEEIHINDFVANVLPKADCVRVLFEQCHLGNLVTMTGPQDQAAKHITAWDNGFAWSYSGGMADSVKERVKNAGGAVDGWMRISLSWTNTDDLDIHMTGAGFHLYFGHMTAVSGTAKLDVDMNRGGGNLSRTPVENINISRQLPDGNYAVYVNNYNARDSGDKGYDVEIEVNGELIQYSSPTSPATGSSGPKIAFTVRDGAVSFGECKLAKTSTGVVKWGLKTGMWHTVHVMTLSPNHWTNPIGNKHWFFFLSGCKSDEKTRAFLNEQLRPELTKDRKVCEVLGDSIEVLPAEGVELSGIGFSETVRNHVYVEVTSTFKRVLKVLF